MTIEQTHDRVREARELSETVLDWIENPTSDAPPAVVANHLVDLLVDIERDLLSDLLELTPRISGGTLTTGERRSN